MKRLLPCLLSLAIVCANLGSASGAHVSSEPLQPAIQLLNRELYEDKNVETYQIATQEQGSYVEVADFSSQRQAGTAVAVNGVWRPYFAELTLEFYADDGTATLGFLRSGEHNVFHLNSSSALHLRIRTDGGLSLEEGTLQLTILEP